MLLAVGFNDSDVAVLRTADLSLAYGPWTTLTSGETELLDIQFTCDGSQLVGASFGRGFWLLDFETGTELGDPAYTGWMVSASISGCERRLAFGMEHGWAAVWTTLGQKFLRATFWKLPANICLILVAGRYNWSDSIASDIGILDLGFPEDCGTFDPVLPTTSFEN